MAWTKEEESPKVLCRGLSFAPTTRQGCPLLEIGSLDATHSALTSTSEPITVNRKHTLLLVQ